MFGRLSFLLPWMGEDVQLSDAMPAPEGTNGAPGNANKASRDNHVHERLASVHSGLTLDAGGLATVTFTRTFVTPPSIFITAKQIGVTPLMLEYTYITSNGLYVGATVKGYKGQVVAVSILGINVNAFGGNPAGGEFSLIALQTS